MHKASNLCSVAYLGFQPHPLRNWPSQIQLRVWGVLLVTEAGSGAEPQKISNLVQFLKSDIRWQQLTMLLKINPTRFRNLWKELVWKYFHAEGVISEYCCPKFLRLMLPQNRTITRYWMELLVRWPMRSRFWSMCSAYIVSGGALNSTRSLTLHYG